MKAGDKVTALTSVIGYANSPNEKRYPKGTVFVVTDPSKVLSQPMPAGDAPQRVDARTAQHWKRVGWAAVDTTAPAQTAGARPEKAGK